jgi:Asparagine synthase (glutamine-hydrolyzing)
MYRAERRNLWLSGFKEKNNADYPYRGTSDTEVILAMYQEKGKELLNELPGMFAFAIWNEEKQVTFLRERPLW